MLVYMIFFGDNCLYAAEAGDLRYGWILLCGGTLEAALLVVAGPRAAVFAVLGVEGVDGL